MNESIFNYEYELNGNKYICNGLSGEIIHKPDALLSEAIFSESDLHYLVSKSFLYPNGINQISQYITESDSIQKNEGNLDLTLMLHEGCNFRCVYCFEELENKSFEKEKIPFLLEFIEKNTGQNGSISIHYYGGEPLLAWDKLILINEGLKKTAEAKNASYSFYITTNGSLLDAPKADYLEQNGVSHVKITLDGPLDVHNLRRKHADGQGTFKRIMDNLETCKGKFPIIIRVNVDNENIDYIHDLIAIMKISFSGCDNIYADYNIVYNKEDSELEKGMHYDLLHAIQLETVASGIMLALTPITRKRGCKFKLKNSFLVDSAGELYICSKKPEFHIGNIFGEIDTNNSSHNKKSKTLFSGISPECRRCRLLPICAGGCTLLKAGKGCKSCPPWKQDFGKYLQIQHLNMLLQKKIFRRPTDENGQV